MMSKAFIQYCLLFALISITCTIGKSQEVRGSIEYQRKILPKLECGLNLQVRNNIDDFSNHNTIVQSEISYEPFKRFAVSGSFRYVFGKKTDIAEVDDEFYDKYRITTDLSYKTKRFENDFRFSSKLRYQYSFGHNEEDKHYIRNKLKSDYKFTDKINPYVAVEPYFKIQDQTINKWRIYIGNEFEMLRNKLELYFIIEAKLKDGIFDTSHFIGTAYKF